MRRVIPCRGTAVITLLILCTGNMLPGETGGVSAGRAAWLNFYSPHNLSVGGSVYHFYYTEILGDGRELMRKLGAPVDSIAGVPKSDEYGYVPAFNIAYTFFGLRSRAWINAAFEAGGGKDTYDGAEQAPEITPAGDTIMVYTPYKGTKNNTFTRGSFHLGAVWYTSALLLKPYFGIEWNYWKRNFRGLLSNEKYIWLYLPLGAHTQLKLNDRFSMGLDCRYNHMIHGTLTLNMNSFILEALDMTMDIPVVAMDRKPGWRVEMPLRFISEKGIFAVKVKPWLEYREFGESAVYYIRVTGPMGSGDDPFLEPASRNRAFGIEVSLDLNGGFWAQYFGQETASSPREVP